jgi:hypothetical protein
VPRTSSQGFHHGRKEIVVYQHASTSIRFRPSTQDHNHNIVVRIYVDVLTKDARGFECTVVNRISRGHCPPLIAIVDLLAADQVRAAGLAPGAQRRTRIESPTASDEGPLTLRTVPNSCFGKGPISEIPEPFPDRKQL